MISGDVQNPGIIPRALEDIFTLCAKNIHPQPSVKMISGRISLVDDNSIEEELILRDKLLSMDSSVEERYNIVKNSIKSAHHFETQDLPNKAVFIWISFAEIYSEIIYDLLSPVSTQHQHKPICQGLKIGTNAKSVFIKNITSVYVKNSCEAYKLLTLGLKRLTYASTAINDRSSRSHCIFFIDFITYASPDKFTHNSYKFCDLAGSERQHKTENTGRRLKESQRINTSLMVLGRCLQAVYNNQMKKNVVVPVRESKLTMLLQAPLMGNEKLTMIVNVTPADNYFEENNTVLEFASIAKNIVVKPFRRKSTQSPRYSWFAAHALCGPQSSLMSNNTKEFERLSEENIM